MYIRNLLKRKEVNFKMDGLKALPTDKLRLQVEKLWLEHIKLCQDNFLYFVKEVWPDIVMKQEKDKDKWGHHQIMAHEFTKIATQKKGGS